MTRPEATSSPSVVPILMYHSISSAGSDAFRPFVVSPELFAEHMGWLAARGYHTLTAGDLAALRREGQEPPPRSVVLTFDDAFRDFVEHALPVLQEHRLRATLFVPTGYVGSGARWLVAEREERRALLSWSELKSIASAGVECGAHSHSHAQLDLLDRRAAAREVALSQTLLEDRLQLPVRSFAYPFGYSSRAVRELVDQRGLTGFAVGDLPSTPYDDPRAVPRLTVTWGTTTTELEALVSRPRDARDVATSRARAVASRTLRTLRVKKRANAPERAPVPPTVA
jgi:peptidoglycan/xylan/chitin deacetylase (PgdA/CDA1 family)